MSLVEYSYKALFGFNSFLQQLLCLARCAVKLNLTWLLVTMTTMAQLGQEGMDRTRNVESTDKEQQLKQLLMVYLFAKVPTLNQQCRSWGCICIY